MRILFKYVFGPILGIIVGRAVLFAIHEIGYQPDVWFGTVLASMYLNITNSGAIWVLSAVIGLALYILELRYKLIEKFFRQEKQRESIEQIKKNFKSPNYQAWDQVNEFTLIQAAFLWAEVEPFSVSLEEANARAWLTMLEDAAANRKDLKVNLTLDQNIKLRQGMVNVINMHTRVSRDELQKFAINFNLMPRFLFPKGNTLNLSVDKTLSNTKENEKDFIRGFNHARSGTVTTKDAALTLLTQLRTEGITIRNEANNVYNTDDWNNWSLKVNEWTNDVTETLKPISNEDSEWFATQDIVSPAQASTKSLNLSDSDRIIFQTTISELDFRLKRLEALLKKYGIGA